MTPIYFKWALLEIVTADGAIIQQYAMIPMNRQMNVCLSQYDIDQVYQLDVVAAKGERSDAAHKRYMASITEAWNNLPEEMSKEYPTPDHLRKRALIKCGFYHENIITFDSMRDAARHAAYVKPMDPFAVVVVKETVVRHYRAKSQKYLRSGGMDKEEFNASSEAVLALLAPYIGITKSELKNEGAKP